MAEPARPHAHRADPEVVHAYLQTDLGRGNVRRYLVECAAIREGDQALVLADSQAPPATGEVMQVMGEMLREMGAELVVMQVDDLIPRAPGAMYGSFAGVDKHKLPKSVFAAIQAADIVFNFTASAAGATKYNLDCYTLETYYGRPIFGGGEAYSGAAHPEAYLFPTDLLRVIGDRVNDFLFTAAEGQVEFRLTNPWGTDLRFTALPGDISQTAAGLRKYPREERFRSSESNRLLRSLVGFSVMQRCEGVWVTKYSILLGGALSEPMRVTIDTGFMVDAQGGPEVARLKKLMLESEPGGVHAVLMGINPKTSPFEDGRYRLDNDGTGMGIVHCSLGGPGLFYRKGEWGPVGNTHSSLGNIPKVNLWAGKEQIVEDGRLRVLSDPAVRATAAQYGDPDVILRAFDWSQAEV